MRSYLYLLALLFFSNVATAQIQRGDQLIGLTRGGGLLSPAPASLGGLTIQNDPFTDATQVGLGLGVTYGYALLDRLVVGARVGVGVAHTDEWSGSYQLDPFARYYLINRPGLGVFGEVGTRVYKQGGQFGHSSAFEQLDLRAGLQLPVAAGLLFTPAVEYTAVAGRNVLAVGAGLELLLQPRTDGEQPTGDYGKGTVTLGAQSISLARRRQVLQAGLSIGGQYFLTDRFAAGVQLGFSYVRINSGDFSGSVRDFYGTSNVDLGVSGRYYLSAPKRLVWFVDGGAGYVHNWRSSYLSPDTHESSTTYLNAGGGAQYFIRNKVALEVAPQLRYHLTEDGLNGGTLFGVNFGFRVIL